MYTQSTVGTTRRRTPSRVMPSENNTPVKQQIQTTTILILTYNAIVVALEENLHLFDRTEDYFDH